MIYVASPRTLEGTAERLADCHQCLSTAFSRHISSAWQATDADLIAAAVEAGWDEKEVQAVLSNLQSGEAAQNARLDGPKVGEAQTPEFAGDESAEGLRASVEAEEHRIERQKGSPLAKGEERFEERSRSSDGRSAGEKQNPEE